MGSCCGWSRYCFDFIDNSDSQGDIVRSIRYDISIDAGVEINDNVDGPMDRFSFSPPQERSAMTYATRISAAMRTMTIMTS